MHNRTICTKCDREYGCILCETAFCDKNITKTNKNVCGYCMAERKCCVCKKWKKNEVVAHIHCETNDLICYDCLGDGLQQITPRENEWFYEKSYKSIINFLK